MSARERKPPPAPTRYSPRLQSVREISLNYEGRGETIHVRPPDISRTGMFVNTSRVFPEGAVLAVKCKLARSGVEIRARGEVRYCLPGVGIGVEFTAISPEAVRAIEEEIGLDETRHRRAMSRSKSGGAGQTVKTANSIRRLR